VLLRYSENLVRSWHAKRCQEVPWGDTCALNGLVEVHLRSLNASAENTEIWQDLALWDGQIEFATEKSRHKC
jgi:hypothetical protein